MNLNEKDQIIHNKAIEVSKRYLKCESELIQSLQEVDQNKIFYKLGYSSLSDYARRALKLSEDTAQNFVTVARKALLVPELKQAIDEGHLTVSKARKIIPVITPQNQHHWLELAKSSTQKTIEKEVAKVSPHSAVIEQAKYITGDSLKVTLALSEKVYKMLKRAQDLESKKAKASKTVDATLESILTEYLEKNDSVVRAERISNKQSNAEEYFTNNAAAPKTRLKTDPLKLTSKDTPMTSQTLEFVSPVAFPKQLPFIRTTIPAELKRQVILRDKDQCQHQYPDGSKCENQRFTQVHHKIPISHGGQNGLQNLITLCSGHHKARHLEG
jgi:hypothetical protein